ncbi:hypothetical protein LINGRAHAP2_LOCUS34686 [Linum grandiflorum]
MGPAMVMWPLHASSLFSVHSLFSALRGREFHGLADFPFRSIWVKHVLTKIQGFLWLVCDEKSVSHIFLSCYFSWKILRTFSSNLSFFGPLHHHMLDVLKSWKVMNCAGEFAIVLDVFWHAFCWFVWLERGSSAMRGFYGTGARLSGLLLVR